MAKSIAYWGIEVGQSALKALRCRPGPDPTKIEADAFDFIEYPQILSEPGADAEALVRDAISQFLSRNDVRKDRVAISVPGQLGLARFIKLPPVERKKIPDIVKYETKQQIPFPLDVVVWDYQPLAGGMEEQGISLETEVGLFAMKREQVYRLLQPFNEVKVEVDIVQLAPLALANFVAYDNLRDQKVEVYDPESPPEYVVILSLGCETTDIVCTNGYRVWQRNIALGGNHFTKALMKEFDLTFAKAEHLKRNAATSNAPKAVFQAMRPVFADLVSECQRSLNHFTNVQRNVQIKQIVGLGNAMKLPGICSYLQQHLGYKVTRQEGFGQLLGPTVLGSPQFKENQLAFGPCYGLCVQGLRESLIHTNLLPMEIRQDRMIRAKKPWAVAAAAVLLVGLSLNSVGYWRQWSAVHDSAFGSSQSTAQSIVDQTNGQRKSFEDLRKALFDVQGIGDKLVANNSGRLYWMEVLKAIDVCLPKDNRPIAPQPEAGGNQDDEANWWKAIREREQIYIRRIEVERCDDLEEWYKLAKAKATGAAAKDGEAAAADTPLGPDGQPIQTEQIPKGKGWIVQLTGHHYHNPEADPFNNGRVYVTENFVRKLSQPSLLLQTENGEPVEYPIGELGIQAPMIVDDTPINWKHDTLAERTIEPYPLGGNSGGGIGFGGGGGMSGGGAYEGPAFGGSSEMGSPFGQPGPGGGLAGGAGKGPRVAQENAYPLPRFDFQIQFAWQETPTHVRVEKRRLEALRLEEEQKAAAAAAAAQGGT